MQVFNIYIVIYYRIELPPVSINKAGIRFELRFSDLDTIYLFYSVCFFGHKTFA